MLHLLQYESSKSPDLLYGAGWFVFGITLTASGWFSVTTSSEGLRNLVPPDAALFAAIGLQTGVLSSAYFLARLTRRRVYWLVLSADRRYAGFLLLRGNEEHARGRCVTS